MAYSDFPTLNLDVVRGVTQRVHFGTLTKNGVIIDPLKADVKIHFKADIDISRHVLLEKTVGSGLEVENGAEILLHFYGTDFENLSDKTYFGDLRCKIDGDEKMICRILVNVSGTATLK